jgi:O-antigen/teichoic acid export membrane protein
LDILKLARRSILLMGTSFVKMLTQMAIIILFAKKLSVNDYGSYQSIWMYINIISVIALFGLPSLLLSNTFSNVTTWIKTHKKICAFYIVVISILPITYLFYMDNNMRNGVKYLLVISTLIQIISTLVEVEAIKKEREILLFTSNLIFNVLYFIYFTITIH